MFLRIHVDWHYSYVTWSQRAAQLLCRTCKTYQLTLSAYCRSTSLRTACTFAMALAAYDWLVWKDRAASFLRAHPREVALQLTWGQRLVVPGAREAYAVATYEREAMGRSLGAAPCNLCGCWTHSWCEACKTRPPTAICSTCDAAKLLCQSCTSCHQLVYSEASEATIATSIPPGTGGAKLCSASSMVEAALQSHTSTAASVQPPVVNDSRLTAEGWVCVVMNRIRVWIAVLQ